MSNFSLKIAGNPQPLKSLDLTLRPSIPYPFSLVLPYLEAVDFGDSLEIYYKGTRIFKSIIEELEETAKNYLKIGNRDIASKGYRVLTGEQTWTKQTPKTIVQALMLNSGLTEGGIDDPISAHTSDIQTTDTDFNPNSHTHTMVNGSGVAAYVTTDKVWIMYAFQLGDDGWDYACNGCWQSFLCQHTAKHKIECNLHAGPSGNSNIQWKLTKDSCNGTVVASGSCRSMTPDEVAYVVLTDNVDLVQGTTYWFSVWDYVDSMGMGWNITDDQYANGQGYDLSCIARNYDAAFKVYYWGYYSQGTEKSVAIGTGVQGWLKFKANVTLNGKTMTCDILDGSTEAVLKSGLAVNVEYAITDIDKTAHPTLKARGNLNNGGYGLVSVELNDWWFSYLGTKTSFKTDYDKKCSETLRLANDLGCILWVEPDEKYYFRVNRGSDKSGSIIYKAGENCYNVHRSRKLMPFTNYVKGIGPEVGGSRIEAVEEDAASQATYGKYEEPVTDLDTVNEDTLRTLLLNIIALRKNPYELAGFTTNELLADSSGNLAMPSDKIHLIDEVKGIDVSERIAEIHITVNGSQELFEITLRNRLVELSDKILKSDKIIRWLK